MLFFYQSNIKSGIKVSEKRLPIICELSVWTICALSSFLWHRDVLFFGYG